MELQNAIVLVDLLMQLSRKHGCESTTRDDDDQACELVREAEQVHGFTVLGAGYYSMVFSHPACPSFALKLCVKRDEDVSETYYTYCKAYPDKHIPIIYYTAHDNDDNFVAVLDKMRPTDPERYKRVLDWRSRDTSTDSVAVAYRTIRDVFLKLATIDLHVNNVMTNKNGVMVLTDPFSDVDQDKSRALRHEIETRFAL